MDMHGRNELHELQVVCQDVMEKIVKTCKFWYGCNSKVGKFFGMVEWVNLGALKKFDMC